MKRWSFTASACVRWLSLIALLPLMGCQSTMQAGIASDKDFCFGVCSYSHHDTQHEPRTVEPVELDIFIRDTRPETIDDCSKENPEACY